VTGAKTPVTLPSSFIWGFEEFSAGSRKMEKPGPSDRQKFDAVMYQQFKPDTPKKPKGVWRLVGPLIVVLFLVLVYLLLFKTP
jgi:hypothetical protein